MLRWTSRVEHLGGASPSLVRMNQVLRTQLGDGWVDKPSLRLGEAKSVGFV